MQREIRDVRRCRVCGMVLQALVHDVDLDEAGERYEAVYWLPRQPHSRDDCDRMVTLTREQWPTLF